MVVESTSFTAFIAALLISILPYCSAESVYCVTPTASSCSSCPHNSAHCATLSEYAQEAKFYFTSNTTMVFLSGDHTLDRNITVAKIIRLTMQGESSSKNMVTIICSRSVGFSFTSMVEFKIYSLAIAACSRNDGSPPVHNYALLLQSITHAELVNCSFHDNLDTALVVNNTNIMLAGNSKFTHNHCVGGCITALSSNLTFTGNTTFLENVNTVTLSDGGGGGAIYASDNSVLSFNGINTFISNLASQSGGAIYISVNSVLSLSGSSNFVNNSAHYCGGAIFTNENTILIFNGTINFTNNGPNRDGINTPNLAGGGVNIGPKSIISILPNTTVDWTNNHAFVGGAIYVSDNIPLSYCNLTVPTCVPKEQCFFQLPGQNVSSSVDAQFIFKNNSADITGSVLFGGVIDNCKLTGLGSYRSGKVFDMLVHIEDENTNSSISSEPLQVCPCENSHPDCSKSIITLSVYPGETFTISTVAVGQRYGIVPALITSSIDSSPLPTLLSFQYHQRTTNKCTKLNYTVFSMHDYVIVSLYASGPCSTFNELLLNINILLNCPPGFNLSHSARSCICESRLAKYTDHCYITNGLGTLTRNSGQQFWVGYDNQSDGLILYPHCPFDYCVSQTVVIPFNNTDIQCAHDRSGLLCGACKTGYSLVLGTSQCKRCTNSHLALLIPFALMGAALVFLLLVCKLTVATGTLSGLVFYANIVGVNRAIFLPGDSTNTLSVFIAWLNLDFGIQTCFYNEMDAYYKAWLQFVFPVYLWVIIGLIVLVSHFSQRFTNLLGNNPVSVLATLILLSYTKILRTVITAIYVIYLEYPTYNRRVWLYDANIDYLSGKHIPLFLVAVLVFLFLFLPYTLLLLFGQWLQAMSHLRLFSWVNNSRLKPFMDSYHAPYKAKHRYWPGLLLVLRFVLFLVFALNLQQDTSISLLAIQVGTGMLQMWAWVNGGVYRNWSLDALEGSFVLNLVILVGATYHVEPSRKLQLAVGYTSISIAFATFIVILVFQLANLFGIVKCLKRKCAAVAIGNAHEADAEVGPPNIDSLPDRLVNPGQYEPPLHTPQRHATAERELVNEAQRRLFPAYTYGSIN